MLSVVNAIWEDLISLDEFSKKFNIGKQTLYNWRDTKELQDGKHCFKLNGKIMVSKKAILEKMSINVEAPQNL